MPINSYAQNFEDIILWRALKHIVRGRYIDIGAQHPVIDSVSLTFYEQGWRGVHVEPVAFYANKLREARTDEEVIQAAIGPQQGSIEFWDFQGTGLSTGNRSVADWHMRRNRKCMGITVASMRLADVFELYRDEEINWLKIDVEGMEAEVIQSWQPSKTRPWIVVVESTKPLSSEITFADFEPLLLKLGYDFVYFDGLNRFYVSRKHPELKKAFGPGPNIFDDAVLNIRSSTVFCKKLNAEFGVLNEKLSARDHEVARLTKSIETERTKVAALDDALAKAALAWEQASATLSAELVLKNSEIAKREERIAHLQNDLADFDSKIAPKGEPRTPSTAAFDQTTTSGASKKEEEIAALTLEVGQKREALAVLTDDTVQKNKIIATLTAQVRYANKACAILSGEISKKNEMIAVLTDQIADMTDELAATSVELAAKTGQLAALSAEIVNKERATTALIKEIAQRDEAITTRDIEIAGYAQRVAEMKTWAESALAHQTMFKQRVDELDTVLTAVLASTSWQITSPLRFIKRSANWFAGGTWAWLTLKPGSRPRRVARRLVLMAARQPLLVATAKIVLLPLPGLRRRLQRIANLQHAHELKQTTMVRPTFAYRPQVNSAAASAIDMAVFSLESDDVQRVYRQLVRARNRKLKNM